MTYHPEIASGIMALFLFLLGIGWAQLNHRLKRVEDWKVDKGFCKTKGQLLSVQFNGIERRLTDSNSFNVRDHEKIDDQLEHMRGMLEEMRDCLIKLANNRPC